MIMQARSTRAQRTILFAFCCLLTMNASAFIIVNDAALETDWPMSDYLLVLAQSIPPGQGLFAISIIAAGNNDFEFNYSGIAEYYALYAAVSGTALTPAYAQNTTPLVANYAPGPFSSTINIPVDSSIFLGYWDDRDLEDVPSANDSYGWIELMNTTDGLTIWDGATAIGGGIYVGTYSQIPEPSTLILMCTGAASLVWKRRRRGSVVAGGKPSSRA